MKIFCSFLFFLASLLFAQAQDAAENEIERLHTELQKVWLNYPQEALKFGDSALIKSEEINDSLAISKSYRLIAGIYYYKGQYDSSLVFNFQALEIATQVRDSSLINNCFNNIGLLYYNLGNYEAALEFLLRAEQMKIQIGEEYGMPLTLANIGLIYMKNDSVELARTYFRRSNTVSKQATNKDFLVYAQNNIASSFLASGDLDSAMFYYKKAGLLAATINNVNWGAASLLGIGQVLNDRGKKDSAKYFFIKGLEASQSIQNKAGIAEAFYLIANFSLQHGDLELAEYYLNQGHEMALDIKQRQQISNNLKLYVDLFKRKGNTSKVILFQDQYIQFQDSVHALIIASNLAAVPEKLAAEKQRDLFLRDKASLVSQKNINRVYGTILIIAVPLILILVYLLRRNGRANQELKENNQELIKTQKLLVTSEKMASLGVLAAGVGHEINNPLNFIKNGIEALTTHIKEKESVSYEELDQYFNIIGEGVSRATTIVKSLSHFSRKGANRNEACNIHDIVENCLLILHNKIKNKVRIVTNFTKKGAELQGNEGRLHQVMMNIIANAEQAIQGVGTIKITTENKEKSIVIFIEDDGEGIEKNHLDKVSDPFFTTKPPGEGTGLGLFITFSIIEEHKGHVDIVSERGVGTKFVIELPKNQQDDE